MKYFRFLLFALFLIQTGLMSAQKKVKVGVVYIQPYCGGARPTPEIEAEAKTPKPYAGKTLIIVSDKKKVDSVITDQNGFFTKKLKKGKYWVYQAWRYHRSTPNGDPLSIFDKMCLEEEWKKDIMTIQVSAGSVKIDSGILVEPCPWSMPCLLEQHMPPRRE